MKKASKIILSILRTLASVPVMALGIYAFKLGTGWHNNFLATINSEIAFAAVLFLVIGGTVVTAAGIYMVSPIWCTAISAVISGQDDEEETKEKIRALRRKYLW